MSESVNRRGRRDRVSRAKRATPTVTAGELCAAVEEFAPFSGAAEWDNVGLLAGRNDWPLQSVLLAIDLTDRVAQEALDRGVGALLLYHPPVFKGIKRITEEAEAPTRMLPDLLAARISIVAMHTALDAAEGGTNDILLDAYDTVRRRPLEPTWQAELRYKLVVFVPHNDVAHLRTALSEAGAGAIGHYSECSFELAGRGTFRGDETTNPRVGRKLALEHADEVRLEMVVPRKRCAEVVRALYEAHSYEEPAFDLYPLHALSERGRTGMGRVGDLRRPTRGDALLKQLARVADLSRACVVGSLRAPFTSVTAAAGSFGVRAFRDPQSLVVTGEFKHHDALELNRRGITAIRLGHYESERPLLAVVQRRVAARLSAVRVLVSRSDRSPFVPAAP